MSIVATTLTAAITQSQTTIPVTSVTNITAPNWQTGAGITYLFVDQEFMLVTAVNTTTLVVSVARGWLGSQAQSHVTGSQVQSGLPTDFSIQQMYDLSATIKTLAIGQMISPATFLAGTADAIPNSVPGFYVVKTGSANAMTLAAPPASAEGNIIEIWSDTLFAHTLTATSLLANGTALKTTATFPAFRGAGLRLRACNGVYHVMSNGASAGIVVLT